MDQSVDPWGHILADQFVLTGNLNEDLNKLSSDAQLIADFEGDGYGEWKKLSEEKEECCAGGKCEADSYYKPWYASRFKDLDEVVQYWCLHATELKKNSEFRLFTVTKYGLALNTRWPVT